MANTIRIKRSTNTASPTTLENAELAYSEQSKKLFIGEGTGGSGGSATSIVAIGGAGAFVTLTTDQTDISGDKTFTGAVDVGAATATTAASSDDSTKVATTAYVQAQGYLVANTAITGATKAKITYDADGLVTAGADLTAGDIPSLGSSKILDFDTSVRLSRLDQMAAPTGSVSMNSQKITNLATPVSDSDACTKGYTDSVVNGLDIKASCRVATTANIALSGGSVPTSIDGVTLSTTNADRVLVKDQTDASENGIYRYISIEGSPVFHRTADANADAEVTAGLFVFIAEGTDNADKGFVLTTNDDITVGTTDLTFTQFSKAGDITAGNGLSQTGTAFNVGAGTGITVGTNDVALTGQAAALHNFATRGPIVRTGASTYTVRSIAKSGDGLAVSDGDFISGDPTISLTAALSTVGGLTPAANKFAYYTGASAAALTSLTAFGRSLLDDADAAAGRTTLGLGSMATQAHTSVNIDGGTIDGITFDGGSF